MVKRKSRGGIKFLISTLKQLGMHKLLKKTNLLATKYIFQMTVFILIVIFSNWFKNLTNIPIDLDEVAWVQDAEIYNWRINNDWEKFNWTVETQNSLNWMSAEFRLFDQPHLTKYIYGFVLDKIKINPYEEKNKIKNLLLFTQQSLSNKVSIEDQQAKTIFGEQTILAITALRTTSSIFALLFFLTLFLFIAKKFSLLEAALAIILLINNQTFIYHLHLATADSITLFFMLVTIILFYFYFAKSNLTPKKRWSLFFFSALTSALTADTKINGFTLPLIFTALSMYVDSGKSNFDTKKWLIRTSYWLLIFWGSYIFLQPELWSNPSKDFYHYLIQRIIQQKKFLISFGSYNFFSYHVWLLETFIQSSFLAVKIIKIILFILGWLGILYALTSKTINKSSLTQNSLVLLLFIWILIFSYAKVGFDRYAMLPIIILTIIITYGFKTLIKKFINK